MTLSQTFPPNCSDWLECCMQNKKFHSQMDLHQSGE